MRTAAECRAKADAASVAAGAIANAAYKAEWNAMAKQWTSLAVYVDRQEALQSRFRDRVD